MAEPTSSLPPVASECTKRKHSPPDKQMQGGSWVLNTVTGDYIMRAKSTAAGGRVLPFPTDPSVYSKMYRAAAALAKAGNYSLLETLDVPDSYLAPTSFGTDPRTTDGFQQELCSECLVVAECIYLEILTELNPQIKSMPISQHRPFKGQLDIDIKPSIDKLSRSADEGCILCRFVLDSLAQVPRRIEQHAKACGGARDFPIQVVGVPGTYYRLMVWLRHPKDQDLAKRTKALDLCATIPRDPAMFPVYVNHIGVRLSANFLSANTTKFFRHWLGECEAGHETCNAYSGRTSPSSSSSSSSLPAPPPPKRLIDVGDALCEPRLVELDTTSRVQYATLSYCWGQSWNCKTTRATLEAHKQRMSLVELSPTLRQAILLARQLGLQYLWVDALCIVQDEPADWAAESMRMADIYRGSLVTLAVPQASSAMQGILPDSVPERARPVKLTTGRTPTPLFIDSVPQGWAACIDEDALNGRAWALQERLLACRTLFFGSQQLFWECKTARASQHQYSNLAQETDIVLAPSSSFNSVPPLDSSEGIALYSLNRHNTKRDYFMWYNTVADYSTKALSVASDKLPALAGIAQAFAHEDDLYIAGTWMNDILGGLTWMPDTPRSLRRPLGPSSRPRAPSWSWASVDGRLSFPLSSPHPEASALIKAGKLASTPREPDNKTSPYKPSFTYLTTPPDAPADMVYDDDDDDGGGDNKDAITINLSGALSYEDTKASGFTAQLLDVAHRENDFLGTTTDVPLTLRSRAEWVVARTSTSRPEPPSSYNEWMGTYDDFTGNWVYSFDLADQDEPCRCLRFPMVMTEEQCYALLLRQRPDGRFERIGFGIANCLMVDFRKLVESPEETIVLC